MRKKEEHDKRNMRMGKALKSIHLLCAGYCANRWGNNSEQHRRGSDPDGPCTVAWLPLYTT